MGLGKTLQSLALIAHARQAEPGLPPFLIVAPTSVVSNWAAESARFTPELTVVAVAETSARRGTSLAEHIAGRRRRRDLLRPAADRLRPLRRARTGPA